MALTENERGVEMATLNRELIADLTTENRDLRDRVAWLEATVELGQVMVRDALARSVTEVSAVRRLLLTLRRPA